MHGELYTNFSSIMEIPQSMNRKADTVSNFGISGGTERPK